MKTRLKKISKSTLSIILAITMLLSCMMVGMISANSVAPATDLAVYGDVVGDWDNPTTNNLPFDSSGYAYFLASETKDYYFKLYETAWSVDLKPESWNGSDHVNIKVTVGSSSATTARQDYGTSKSFYFSATKDTAYRFVLVSHSTDYDANKVTFKIEKLADLSTEVTVGASSLAAGKTTTIGNSNSGGSGSYTNTYKVTQGSANGTDVTNATLGSSTGTTFTAPQVTSTTTYYVTTTVKDSKTGATTTSSAKTITVSAAAATSYNVTVSAGTGGTVTAGSTSISEGQSSTVSVTQGASINLSATPKDGYSFTGWTVSGSASVGSTSSASTTLKATANGGTVTANFTKNSTGGTYYLWYSTSSNNPKDYSKSLDISSGSVVIPDAGNSNVYFLINNSATSATSGTQMFTTTPTVTPSGDGFSSAQGGNYWYDKNYYIAQYNNYSSNNVTVTWSSSSPNNVTLTVGGSTSGGGDTGATYYYRGSHFEEDAWSTGRKMDKTNDGLYYIEVSGKGEFKITPHQTDWDDSTTISAEGTNLTGLTDAGGNDHNIKDDNVGRHWIVYDPANKKVYVVFKSPAGNTVHLNEYNGGYATISTSDVIFGEDHEEALPSGTVATVTVTSLQADLKPATFTLAAKSGSESQDISLYPDGTGTYTGTFTVPAYDAVVTINDDNLKPFNLDISASTSGGSVIATVNGKAISASDPYPEDTPVIITANPADNYSFQTWSDVIYSADREKTKVIYYVNRADADASGTIKITGSFVASGYKVYGDKHTSGVDMKLLDNGYYLSTQAISKGENFYLYRKTGHYSHANSNGSYHITDGNKHYVHAWYENNPGNKYYNDYANSYVVYDPVTDTLWLTSDSKGHSAVKVRAKDGIVRDSVYDNGNLVYDGSKTTSNFGKTEITRAAYRSGTGYAEVIGNENKYTEWNDRVATVKFTATQVTAGAFVSVSTKIAQSKQGKLGIAAFSVNGTTYPATQSKTDIYTYSFTYSIPEYSDSDVEITPIYEYIDNTETIRFYVTGVDDNVYESWGDTIYCYVYDDGAYPLGNYPGQPMIYENGRYYVDVPKIIYNKNKTQGVTLNNGTWDSVHVQRLYGTQDEGIRNNNQRQTYDYDDFLKIDSKINSGSGLKQDIIFEFKYKTDGPTDGNFGDIHGKAQDEQDNFNKYPDVLNPANFTEWEMLTDYYGNNVDVYGGETSGYKGMPLRIVSQGYDKTGVGDFSTSWIIYKFEDTTNGGDGVYKKYKYVGAASESAFIDAVSQDAKLKGIPAKITYEYEIQRSSSNQSSGNNPAYRSDGRWYYSYEREVSAHVLIEWASSRTGAFQRDYFQEGNIDYTDKNYDATDIEGYSKHTFAYLITSEGNRTEDKKKPHDQDSGNSNQFKMAAREDADGNWSFIGWYLYDTVTGTYTLVSEDFTYTTDVTTDAIYVARFIQVSTGRVYISHELLTESLGLGTAWHNVDIVTPEGRVTNVSTNKKDAATTLTASTIKASSVNSIRITLNTDEIDSKFQQFWYNFTNSGSNNVLSSNIGGIEVTVDTEHRTATITVPISTYFFDSTDENGDYKFNSNKTYLKFFSELEKNPTYTIVYNFKTRLYGMQSYTVSDTFTNEEFNNTKYVQGTTLLKDFIDLKSPYEKNFGETLVLDAGTLKKTGDYKASIDFKVIYDAVPTAVLSVPYNPDEASAEKVDKLKDNTTLTIDLKADKYLGYFKTNDGKGDFYTAPAKIYDGKDEKVFSYWDIYTLDNGGQGKKVTKCFSTTLNYVAFDSYYIVAVYEGEPDMSDALGRTTTATYLGASRNQWNNATGADVRKEADRIYIDFALAFYDGDLLLSKQSGYEVGLVIQKAGEKDNPSAATNPNDEDIKDFILNSSKNKPASGSCIKKEIALSSLDNKNRIEYYYGFENTEKNRNNIYRIYSYIKTPDGDVALSEAMVVDIYDIAMMDRAEQNPRV